MRILSIGKTFEHHGLNIQTIDEADLATLSDIKSFHYIIISGGDGTLRRVIKQIHTLNTLPKLILNPTGSFNFIAKMHRVPKVEDLLQKLAQGEVLNTQAQEVYTLNKEVFLFSAGNMTDLQHILLSETLRFGILKKGMSKYLLSFLFLFPLHIIMTPFMLLSPRRFFIFTLLSSLSKFGSFYAKVEQPISINLENSYNLIELDGDVLTIEESVLNIAATRSVEIVHGNRQTP